MVWIIEKAAESGELSFRSEKDGGERETAFHQGRQFVGQQVQKLIGLPVGIIAKIRETENAGTDTFTRADSFDRAGS